MVLDDEYEGQMTPNKADKMLKHAIRQAAGEK
jgi:hypothetical protein